MCLGSGRSKGPDIKTPTAPDVKKAPADERVSGTTGKPVKDFTSIDASIAKKDTKTWDDVGTTSKSQDVSRHISDSGINY